MHNISQLSKQQVGLRLPRYLVDEIDELSRQFSINKTDIITEAISSYIKEQKALLFYDDFDKSCKELKSAIDTKSDLRSLDDLIDELEDSDS
ncbi:MAG: ribbon-helix-helix domain-containing protein [Epsilonproteobacteria bacterium]|nr:ribbon-helix-helix domain-containing protein [Campylobacterota bacterium]